MSASGSSDPKGLPVILLVTAADVEGDELQRALFEDYEQRFKSANDLMAGCDDLGQIGGARVFHIQSMKGPDDAQHVVGKGIDCLQATVVIYVGMAGGIKAGKAELAMGDILVSQEIYSYALVTQRNGRRIPRGHIVPCPGEMHSRVGQARRQWTDPLNAKIHPGLILSGPYLIDDQKVLAKLLREREGAIGCEMEGSGLFKAASERKRDWLVIKGVMDWANGTKTIDSPTEGTHEERRRKASYNAARFTLHLIDQGGWDTLGASQPPKPKKSGPERGKGISIDGDNYGEIKNAYIEGDVREFNM